MSDQGSELTIPRRHRLYGAPLGRAELKRSAEDFVVIEQFDLPLVESSEHLALRIKKTGQNSQWVADQLAKHYQLRPVDVGYAGKKDRHAVTEQWYSLYVSNAALPSLPVIEGCEIVQQGYTPKKIRKGDHQGNRFIIRLYVDEPVDQNELATRVSNLGQRGFANYFGNQRFGHHGNNIARFDDAVINERRLRRSDKGIILSSARSAIFNHLLTIALDEGAAVATLTMWGRGRPDAWALAHLGPFDHWRERLEHSGLSMDQRDCLVLPQNLSHQCLADDCIELAFTLPPGAYATTLLEHLFDLFESPKFERTVV